MPDASQINRLGDVVVEEVRRRSILDIEAALRLEGDGPTAKKWRSLRSAASTDVDLVRLLVPDLVDWVVANLLSAVDNQQLTIGLVEDGAVVLFHGEGELAGRYQAEWSMSGTGDESPASE